jgi:hypothetical protein
MNVGRRFRSVCFIAAILCGLLPPVFADAEELFRFKFQTKDGRQFQYVFESSAQPSPRSITKDEATSGLGANVLPFGAWQYRALAILRKAASALACLLCRYD